MKWRRSYFLIGALLAGLFAGRGALAAKHSVLLTSNEVSTHSAVISTLGDYYTIDVAIPNILEGNEVYSALLEFYMDASTVEGASNRTPVIEAYKLKTTFTGTVDPTQFETSSVALTNVVSGENRRVILDITAIIKSYLASPATNHGIILGSLTGARDGDFALQGGELGPGVQAQIIYHYDSRIR